MRKNADVDKQTAAAALLALSENGNGTLFSEPRLRRYCSNVLSMPDVDSYLKDGEGGCWTFI